MNVCRTQPLFFFKFSISALALSLCALVGCGDVEVPELDVSQEVEAVLMGVNDAAGDEEAFGRLFASGTSPENRTAYYSIAIELVEPPTVEGDTASAKVSISQGAAESEGRGGTKNEEVGSGEVTWTLKNVGGEWKLQDAPLP